WAGYHHNRYKKSCLKDFLSGPCIFLPMGLFPHVVTSYFTPSSAMMVMIMWSVCFSVTVRAQESVKVLGTIVDSESQSPVPFVHVYTTTHRNGTISDALGQFELNLRTPDTLIFSSVGYETKLIAFSADDK